MRRGSRAIKPTLQAAMYFGAAVTTMIALLPYVSDFFITAYVIGALAAVWFAVRKQRQLLSFNDGAQLGFLSAFYGLLAATTVYDVVWQFFHYQLWKIQNADRLLSIFIDMVHDAFTPSAWLVITFQIVSAAIFAGIFGAPSGILGVKIFHVAPRRGELSHGALAIDVVELALPERCPQQIQQCRDDEHGSVDCKFTQGRVP